MHDNTPESLRKKALKQGNKTVSKRAQSKQSSLAGSRLASRANSTVNSRNPSASNSRAGSDIGSSSIGDEDDDHNRPDTPNSIDALIAERDDHTDGAWQEHLASIIEQIEDRNWKSSNTQSRQQALIAYIQVLCSHFVQEDIAFRLNQLVRAFVKIVKSEDDSIEVNLALKALSVTMITSPSDEIYEAAAGSIKRTIVDSSDLGTKILAIQTLAILDFYGDLSEDTLAECLNFFLEIVSTDGEYVDALDEAGPVAAALEAWGFLATLVDEEGFLHVEEALETFVDQLDSSSASVLIAAGENIALVYEKAYTPVSEEEISDERDADVLVVSNEHDKTKEYFKRLYVLYPRQAVLETKLRNLQSHSSRSVSRADRKSLHTSFADILHSVQNPTLGPHFATSLNPETGAERGSKLKLKSPGKSSGSNTAMATIDKWWMLHRHRALKEVLGHGFMVHYEVNVAIFEALPIVFLPLDEWNKKDGKRKKMKPWQMGNGNKTTLTIEEWD